MKRLVLVLIALPLVVVLALLLFKMRWKFSNPRTSPQKVNISEQVQTGVTVIVASPPANAPPGQTIAPLGETILRNYANTNFPPENDLTLMSRLMENSLLLLKSAANRPLSANEDWADLFRGQNAAHEVYLPSQHIAFNAHGQLADRWGTPLFFHALGGGRYEIRSAGPDKTMWTGDDLERGYDGQFRRGKNVTNAPSVGGR